MNLLWWGVTILLVLGIAILAIVVFIGVVALFVVSIVEYLEAKLGIVSIGEDEEELIVRAKKLKEEQRKAFKGPWTLTPKVRPYSSKVFQFRRAKEIVENK
ncbi:MAG: hypothetical protein KAJ09_03840 [Deltaproteobacteria bacterium]|nr:hypothetical protein [Deltaproteobacteria bacterium]